MYLVSFYGWTNGHLSSDTANMTDKLYHAARLELNTRPRCSEGMANPLKMIY